MTCAGEQIYANNNTLDTLLAASWTSLQLPALLTLPTVVQAGGVTYKPSRQGILVVQSGQASSLIAAGWQVLMTGCPLQVFLDNGWELTPEGGLDGSNV
jgi:hypothetical protein